jgi:hypothetical protein
MLTPAEIESLRENITLASARDDAIALGATTAELQEIDAKMESLRAALKANDSRQRR